MEPLWIDGWGSAMDAVRRPCADEPHLTEVREWDVRGLYPLPLVSAVAVRKSTASWTSTASVAAGRNEARNEARNEETCDDDAAALAGD